MGTLIVALVLAALVASILVRLVKNKKSGKSSCGCGCSSCAMDGSCHKK